MAKSKHIWFAFPGDSETNDAFSRFVEQGTNGFESEAIRDVLCEDGEKRNLWRVTEQQAWYLWRSRTDLRFRIFNQLGPNGKVRDVTFLFRKDRRSPTRKKRKTTANPRSKI